MIGWNHNPDRYRLGPVAGSPIKPPAGHTPLTALERGILNVLARRPKSTLFNLLVRVPNHSPESIRLSLARLRRDDYVRRTGWTGPGRATFELTGLGHQAQRKSPWYDWWLKR